MKALTCVVACLVLVTAAACNRSSVEIIAREDLPPAIYGGAGARRSNNLVLYMVQGSRLVRVSRTGEASGSLAEVALRELFAGPTSEEMEDKIETRIPQSLDLRGVEVVDDVARVDVSREFVIVQDPKDPHEYLLRVAQIVWTLDELPNINAVQFLVEGQARAVYDQDLDVVSDPVARVRFRRFEPRQDRPVSQAPLQIDI